MDLAPLIVAAAARHGIPAVGLLAMLKAESGLDPRAERWGDRTTRARQCGGDRAALAEVVRDLQLRGLGADISFGLCQMTVGTAAGYGLGNGTPEVGNILGVREALFDRERAIEVGAKHLAAGMARARQAEPGREGDDLILGGLVVYNAGWLPPPSHSWWQRWAGNVASYRRALEWAHEVLSGPR